MRSKTFSMDHLAIVLFLAVSTEVVATDCVGEATSTAAATTSVPAAPETNWRLFDDFDGALMLSWMPVRSDPTHVSLTRRPGTLTIVTQAGSIMRSEQPRVAAGENQVKNMYLVLNPLAHGGDFVVLTCLESFSPTVPWQQAGLIIYDDDDNYLKWEAEANQRSATGVALVCVHEANREPHSALFEAVPNLQRLWLRLTKRGNYYQHAYSVDGEAYVVLGEEVWGNGKPKRVGLFAKNGPIAPETDASFDFFEVRPLSDLEKTYAAEKKQLQGAWEATADRESGGLQATGTVTRLRFSDRAVTVREGDQSFEAQYTCDVARSPKELVIAMAGNWQNKKPFRIAYAVEGDRLTICFHPQPDAAPVTALEAREGRILKTLRRVKADD